jgi:tRNA threonylcarbamoyladenosine biosynthesis protein TsaB
LALLLNIDTAFEHACVCLSRSGDILALEQSRQQKDHASFLQPAIKKIGDAAAIQLSSVDAIAVANGPGSYTGLRIGLSSAKALCYALHKPLILLNTLDVLAYALKQFMPHPEPDVLFCPLIDARRMEVFTALYDIHLNLIKNYAPVILDEHFLEEEKEIYRVVVGGNGSLKLKSMLNSENIIYADVSPGMKYFSVLAHKAYVSKQFADIAYSEPFYLKSVYIRPPK